MSTPNSLPLTQADILKQSATQIIPLGTRGLTKDGRVFRYAKAGAAITKGRLLQAAAVSTNFSDDRTLSPMTEVDSTKAKRYTTDMNKVVMYMSTDVNADDSSWKGWYDEGYWFANDGQGEGQFYQVNVGGWTSGSTSSAMSTLVASTKQPRSTVEIIDEAKLTTQVTTGTEWGLVKNLYKDIIMHAKNAVGIPVGIALINITSGYFFWCQTWGLAPCRFGGSCVRGKVICADLGTNTGYVGEPLNIGYACYSSLTSQWAFVDSIPLVGVTIEVGASGETGVIDLHLAP